MTSLQIQVTYYNTVSCISSDHQQTLLTLVQRTLLALSSHYHLSLQIPLCNPSHCIGGVPTLVTLWKCGVQLTDTALQCFCDYYSLELCTSFVRTAYHAHQKMIQVGTVVCYSISSCLNFEGF